MIRVLAIVLALLTFSMPANAADFDTLTPEEQAEITRIIRDIQKGDTSFLKGFKTPKSTVDKDAELDEQAKNLCRIACDIAFSAAKAACLKLANPIAIAVCVEAAEQARKECRKRC